jgi:antirestriction protein ArdC
MARSQTRATAPKTSLYDEITNRIIAQLEAGVLPWAQPWKDGNGPAVGMPCNFATARGYSGINVLLLWAAADERGYQRADWLTYRQAQDLGGQVRKGERGTGIVFAGRFTPEAEKERASTLEEDPRAIPFLRWYTVFNVAQCDGLDVSGLEPPKPLEAHAIDPEVRAIIDATGIDFRIGGGRAYYSPPNDFVQVPPPDAYFEPIDWHRTALHELGHATGHSSRLARDLSGGFGSEKYAFEELIAELTAAYSCAALGITPTVRHADYIGSWLQVLRDDNRAIVRAASQASKAADWIFAHRRAGEREAGASTCGMEMAA